MLWFKYCFLLSAITSCFGYSIVQQALRVSMWSTYIRNRYQILSLTIPPEVQYLIVTHTVYFSYFRGEIYLIIKYLEVFYDCYPLIVAIVTL